MEFLSILSIGIPCSVLSRVYSVDVLGYKRPLHRPPPPVGPPPPPQHRWELNFPPHTIHAIVKKSSPFGPANFTIIARNQHFHSRQAIGDHKAGISRIIEIVRVAPYSLFNNSYSRNSLGKSTLPTGLPLRCRIYSYRTQGRSQRGEAGLGLSYPSPLEIGNLELLKELKWSQGKGLKNILQTIILDQSVFNFLNMKVAFTKFQNSVEKSPFVRITRYMGRC